MKSTKWIATLACTVALAGAVAIGVGQDKGTAPSADAMQQQAMDGMAQMSKPLPQHAHIAKYAGKWECEMKMTMGPDQPAMTGKGTSEIRMMGDFWAIEESTLDFMGQPMKGHSVSGYDIVKKKFICHWFDTMAPYGMYLEGDLSADGMTMTYSAQGPDMMDPTKVVTFKMVEKWENDDTRVLTMSGPTPDGSVADFWSLTCKRVK